MSITIGKFIQELENTVTGAKAQESGITYDTPLEFFFGKLKGKHTKLEPSILGTATKNEDTQIFFLGFVEEENTLKDLLAMMKGIVGEEQFAKLEKEADDLGNMETEGNA